MAGLDGLAFPFFLVDFSRYIFVFFFLRKYARIGNFLS